MHPPQSALQGSSSPGLAALGGCRWMQRSSDSGYRRFSRTKLLGTGYPMRLVRVCAHDLPGVLRAAKTTLTLCCAAIARVLFLLVCVAKSFPCFSELTAQRSSAASSRNMTTIEYLRGEVARFAADAGARRRALEADALDCPLIPDASVPSGARPTSPSEVIMHVTRCHYGALAARMQQRALSALAAALSSAPREPRGASEPDQARPEARRRTACCC